MDRRECQVLPWGGPALPQMESWREFRDLLERGSNMDASLLIADDEEIQPVPGEVIFGVDVFGRGYKTNSLLKEIFLPRKTRQVRSYLLNDAVLMPNSMVVMDKTNKLHQPSMENVGSPFSIATYDWHFILKDDSMFLSEHFFNNVQTSDLFVAPVCGPGFPNYGHFLYDGLASIMMFDSISKGKISIVGQPLARWQAEILYLLDLLPRYIEVLRPTRFRKMLTSSMLSLHLRHPTRFSRMVFDAIRFRVASRPDPANRRVFLSRGNSTKRVCKNREAVEGAMQKLGFKILHADGLSVEEQVRAMAEAQVVVGEGGAGFANIGFCNPGAKVIEIAVLDDPWTRCSCFQLGHKWYGFFPEADIPRTERGPDWSNSSYTVDCAELSAAVETVVGG